MTNSRENNPAAESSIPIIGIEKVWKYTLSTGIAFWALALILWAQEGVDNAVLFYFNPSRIALDPLAVISRWLSSNGMAAITILFVLYLLASKIFKNLDTPLTINLYTICSYAISGIAGDLLKMVFARPRPAAAFGAEILALSTSLGYAIPSGHATKVISLVLPFLLFVDGKKPLHRAIQIIISLIAAGVCFSRIVLGAHYLSDVLAGIGMGLVGLPLSMAFANMLLRRMKKEMLPRLSYVWGFLLVFLTWIFLSL